MLLTCEFFHLVVLKVTFLAQRLALRNPKTEILRTMSSRFLQRKLFLLVKGRGKTVVHSSDLCFVCWLALTNVDCFKYH